MGLQADDPRAPYQQIADDIRQQILSGALATGRRLPSTRALMDHYGVASQTIQRAVRILQSEGLVHSVAGRGVFISEPPNHPIAEPTAPPGEYRQITDQLDKIFAEMARIDQRLSELEAERDARAASARPAATRRSRTT